MSTRLQVNADQISFIFDRLLEGLENKEGLTGQEFADLHTSAGKLFTPTPEGIANIHEVSMLFVSPIGVKGAFDYLYLVVRPYIQKMYEIKQDIYHSPIVFLSPLLQEQARQEAAMLEHNDDKGPLTDAVSCQRCGALKVHRTVAQTRSADEGQSAIFQCPSCLFSWTEN
jgi:DNA-directed RNA polymerase subunit M/transcription elongation factor TFIIS